jgi:hypothetical protein
MSGKMIEIVGSRIVRHSRKGLLGVLAVAGMCMMRPAAASGQLIESFENTLDGWTFNPSYNTQNYTQTFSTTTGVTVGSYALQINSGVSSRTQLLSGFDYGNLLLSPRSAGLAATLSGASALDIDVFAPSGALGYGPQIDVDVDDGGGVAGGTGYLSLDGYGYPSPANGTEVTMVFPITPAQDAELALDAASTGVDIVMQPGSGTPTGAQIPVLYIDNIQAVPVPEPASLGLLALGASSLMMRRRKA